MDHARLRLAALAAAALAGGLILYLYVRPATLLTSQIGVSALTKGPLGPLTGTLPSALHVFAFALLGVVLVPQLPRLAAVGGALVLGALLELAQLWTAGSLLPLGTFDPWDLLACAAGALAALGVASLSKGPSPSVRKRFGGTPALLVTLAVASSLATSPPPPPGNISANLDRLCPGSTVVLSWEWTRMTDPDAELFLVASDPGAVSPPFERVAVEPWGSREVTILDSVDFYLDYPGREIPSVYVTVLPPEGTVEELSNWAVCSGGTIAWDPVVVSVTDFDKNASVAEVTAVETEVFSFTGPLLVEKDGTSVELQLGETTGAFAGNGFTGSWRIEPAEPIGEQICPIVDPTARVGVGVRVRVVCEAEGEP